MFLLLVDATLAGVKNKDRLIEINGVNVQNLDHQQVLERFRALANVESVQLLVTDVGTYERYLEKKQLIHRRLPNVQNLEPNEPFRSSSVGAYIVYCSLRELTNTSQRIIVGALLIQNSFV